MDFLNLVFRVTFNEEEIIINPEDIDPSVGRFRNLVETTVIPKKVTNLPPNPEFETSGISFKNCYDYNMHFEGLNW